MNDFKINLLQEFAATNIDEDVLVTLSMAMFEAIDRFVTDEIREVTEKEITDDLENYDPEKSALKPSVIALLFRYAFASVRDQIPLASRGNSALASKADYEYTRMSLEDKKRLFRMMLPVAMNNSVSYKAPEEMPEAS